MILIFYIYPNLVIELFFISELNVNKNIDK